MTRARLTFLVALVSVASRAAALDSGSTGALGALTPVADVTIPLPPDGVLNYTDVIVPAGVEVTFGRNARNTPVYLLATGDVVIEGTISVAAPHPEPWAPTERADVVGFGTPPGPGGFHGGSQFATGGGYGFGHAAGGPGVNDNCNGSAGGSAVSIGQQGYANPLCPRPASVNPPVSVFGWRLGHGGSGGAGSVYAVGGGGGGMLVVASGGTVRFGTPAGAPGWIVATGYAFGSSTTGVGGGGTVRIVADRVEGVGRVFVGFAAGDTSQCAGAAGISGFWNGCPSVGVATVETNSLEGDIYAAPRALVVTPPSAPLPWGSGAAPTLDIVSINGAASRREEPLAHPDADPGFILAPGTATVALTARGVAPGTRASVALVVAGQERSIVRSTPLAGTRASTSATATLDIPADATLGHIEAWIDAVPVLP